jgi:hypothetical protein
MDAELVRFWIEVRIHPTRAWYVAQELVQAAACIGTLQRKQRFQRRVREGCDLELLESARAKEWHKLVD